MNGGVVSGLSNSWYRVVDTKKVLGLEACSYLVIAIFLEVADFSARGSFGHPALLQLGRQALLQLGYQSVDAKYVGHTLPPMFKSKTLPDV